MCPEQWIVCVMNSVCTEQWNNVHNEDVQSLRKTLATSQCCDSYVFPLLIIYLSTLHSVNTIQLKIVKRTNVYNCHLEPLFQMFTFLHFAGGQNPSSHFALD